MRGIYYSLRPNKFVERKLFVELLSKIDPDMSPDERMYVSLGGPQLEDHRLVHCRLGIKNLISLEADSVAHKRQEFNRRPTYIECRHETTGDFIRDFDKFSDEHNDKSFIVWLDYTSHNDRLEQLIEYQTLLGKLGEGDILKITMNANAKTLGNMDQRFEAIKTQLNEYLPLEMPEEITKRNFPLLVCSTIRKASLNTSNGFAELHPLPLAIFVYSDGSPMLTVTVCLVLNEKREDFSQKLSTQGWDFLPADWNDITNINVPNLTAKERLYVEGLLFDGSIEDIHNNLPFRFDNNEKISLEILAEYARHYCRYPSFFPVPL